ncbi:MAG: alpha/beta fold hydrolase, partial [Hyphomicrobiales bacterium]|nr:alpha/beta fold hydrolase [Hyphomicrobiales bacterium]
NGLDMMEALGDRLAQAGFDVVAFDRPGAGHSDRFAGRGPELPASQAAIVAEALDAMGAPPAILVGHSLAGAMTLALALDRPDRVAAVTLVSPVTHPWPGGVDRYYDVAAHPVVGWPFTRLVTLPAGAALMTRATKGVFAPGAPPPHFARRTALPLVLRPGAFRANAFDVTAMKAAVTAQTPRYAGLRTPLEIVTGDSDGVVWAHIHSAGCARDVPGARLTTLRGIGHSPHWSAPESVVEAILRAAARAQGVEGAST